MSNTLNKKLAGISLNFFSQGGLRFYFLCASYVWLWKQIHPYIPQVGYTNIQSKIKINGLLCNPFTLREDFFGVFTFSVVIY